ncbi:MAG: hypothetical protein R2708_22040 [Vicinamibacterales bacterium]
MSTATLPDDRLRALMACCEAAGSRTLVASLQFSDAPTSRTLAD